MKKYVGTGDGWVDPFANNNSPASLTNDMDSSTKAKYHMDAQDFVKLVQSQREYIEGVLIVEILLVAHGLHHNDTIVTVEKKVQGEINFGVQKNNIDKIGGNCK